MIGRPRKVTQTLFLVKKSCDARLGGTYIMARGDIGS